MANPKIWPESRASLLIRIRQSDDNKAWRDFVDTYGPLVKWLCTQYQLHAFDADDVVQDVFLRISKAIRQFEYDPRKGRFRDWLRKVTQNCAKTYLRRRKKTGLETGLGGDGYPFENESANNDDVWVEKFGVAILNSAIARIRNEFDDKTWQAFELVWRQHGEPQQVARELEKEPAWVYKAKFKVLKRLEEEVKFLIGDSGSLF